MSRTRPSTIHTRSMREVYAGQTRRLTVVKRIPAWLTYTVLRLVFFVVPFIVFWLLGFQAWIAAILAAVIALALSLMLLTRFRNQTSSSIYRARAQRAGKKSADEQHEDDLLDQN